MINHELIEVLPVNNQLGECILWNTVSQQVYWTDILGKVLYRYSPDNGVMEEFALPESLGSFAFVEGTEDWLLAAFSSGLAKLHIPSLNIEWLWRLPHAPTVRLNDGRVDRQGRFWVGSMVDTADWTHPNPEITGKLFCLQRDGRVTEHKTGIKISNSICWSPDGTTMYFSDSPSHHIVAWDFDTDSGSINHERNMATSPNGIHPDGSIVDAEGYIWNAQWGSGKVVRYSPQGDIDTTISIAAKQATCCAFGGKNLNRLFVSSANVGLNKLQQQDQPKAGAVFIYQTHAKGLPEARYQPL